MHFFYFLNFPPRACHCSMYIHTLYVTFFFICPNSGKKFVQITHLSSISVNAFEKNIKTELNLNISRWFHFTYF